MYMLLLLVEKYFKAPRLNPRVRGPLRDGSYAPDMGVDQGGASPPMIWSGGR